MTLKCLDSWVSTNFVDRLGSSSGALIEVFWIYNRRQNCWHIHSFNPYFVTVIPVCPPGTFQPPHPQSMLCGNCCDLEPQTTNIEWGSGVLFYCAVIRVVLLRALKVLLKDNVSTNYVADCRKSRIDPSGFASGTVLLIQSVCPATGSALIPKLHGFSSSLLYRPRSCI